jgi:hypothetical protein
MGARFGLPGPGESRTETAFCAPPAGRVLAICERSSLLWAWLMTLRDAVVASRWSWPRVSSAVFPRALSSILALTTL